MVRRAAALVLFMACVTCGGPQAALTGPAEVSTVMRTGPSHGHAAPPPNLTPVRLLIPRIAVNAKVESRGLDGSRNLATPANFHDVAWYNLGPLPGTPGNAILNGHVNWWTGSAVFTRLSQLRTGDRIVVVRADGTQVTFKVTARTVVLATARVASLFAPSSSSTLTLITCTGPWDVLMQTDTHRLLVTAALA
jgi:LPXTG-site transpeptidase (sortase) family protein